MRQQRKRQRQAAPTQAAKQLVLLLMTRGYVIYINCNNNNKQSYLVRQDSPLNS